MFLFSSHRGFSVIEAILAFSLVLLCLAFLMQSVHGQAWSFRAHAVQSDAVLKAFLDSEKQVWSCDGGLSSCAAGVLYALQPNAPAVLGYGTSCVNRIVTNTAGRIEVVGVCR